MPTLAYTVTAHLPNEEMVFRLLRWLHNGHVAAVIKGGATSALVVRADDAHRLEVRYLFPGRDDFEMYERDSAPALRAQGQALFGPETGCRFERTVGVVVHEQPPSTPTPPP